MILTFQKDKKICLTFPCLTFHLILKADCQFYDNKFLLPCKRFQKLQWFEATKSF